VLDEQIQQADLVLLNLGKLLQHRVGDEVGAARLGGQGELLLEPHVGLIILVRGRVLVK